MSRERKVEVIQKKKTGDTPIDKTYRYLYRVKSVDDMIDEKQKQLDYWRSRACGTGLRTDSERVQTSGSKDELGECCAKIVDLCAEINQDIDFLVDLKANVMHTIDLLEDLEERRVLYCRYLRYMEYFKISQEMHVSDKTVFRIHKGAIRHLAEILYPESES